LVFFGFSPPNVPKISKPPVEPRDETMLVSVIVPEPPLATVDAEAGDGASGPSLPQEVDPPIPTLCAVERWRFQPGTRNGQKVRFSMVVPVLFNLTEN